MAEHENTRAPEDCRVSSRLGRNKPVDCAEEALLQHRRTPIRGISHEVLELRLFNINRLIVCSGQGSIVDHCGSPTCDFGRIATDQTEPERPSGVDFSMALFVC